MGLFAQVGGTQDQAVWRTSFIIIAAIGVVTTLRLLATDEAPAVTSMRATAAGIYALVAIIGAFPDLADVLALRAIQAEALLLILLVALGHGLVWRFLVYYSIDDGGRTPDEPT